jgi:hypothetical protein
LFECMGFAPLKKCAVLSDSLRKNDAGRKNRMGSRFM